MYARQSTAFVTNSGKVSQAALILTKHVFTSATYVRPCACHYVSSRQDFSIKRDFSSTSKRSLRDIFPAPSDNVNIKVTPPAWHHPMQVFQSPLPPLSVPRNVLLTLPQIHRATDARHKSRPSKGPELERLDCAINGPSISNWCGYSNGIQSSNGGSKAEGQLDFLAKSQKLGCFLSHDGEEVACKISLS